MFIDNDINIKAEKLYETTGIVIDEHVIIADNTTISFCIRVSSPKHWITYLGEVGDILQIGCCRIKLSEWVEQWNEIADVYEFTPSQKKEHFEIISMANKVDEALMWWETIEKEEKLTLIHTHLGDGIDNEYINGLDVVKIWGGLEKVGSVNHK